MPSLAIVTATTSPFRAETCWQTWGTTPMIVVLNGPVGRHSEVESPLPAYDRATVLYESGGYLGSVPAFRKGVDWALANTDADIIAALHDDVEIHDPNWAQTVIRHFDRHPACGLAGFGGALGLGDADIYQKPYAPMQLARQHFRSNLVDAEIHGIRSLVPERVACLDGFSQIGRRGFWQGITPYLAGHSTYAASKGIQDPVVQPPAWHTLKQIEDLGMVHHAYDSALGVLAKRLKWESWYLPIRCRHLGGQTAVGDPGYQEWAKTQTNGVGDQEFWNQAHKALYELGRGILPLRV